MKSHCINGHPYDQANTEWRKDGTFACRTCRCQRQNRRKAAKRGEVPDDPRSYVVDRIADLLEIDGGWWTVPGIAVRLGISERSVYRAVESLGDALEERILELAGAMWGSDGLRDFRREWRHPHVFAESVFVP